jgi:hypothetical protein
MCMLVILNFIIFQDLKSLRVGEHCLLLWDEQYAMYLARAGFLDIALVVVHGSYNGRAIVVSLGWSMVSEDALFPPTLWGDYGHHAGFDHDPWSSTRRAASEWDHLECWLVWHGGVTHWGEATRCWGGGCIEEDLGMNTIWMREHFIVCPLGVDEVVIERHTRVWLWHFVALFLLPNICSQKARDLLDTGRACSSTQMGMELTVECSSCGMGRCMPRPDNRCSPWTPAPQPRPR